MSRVHPEDHFIITDSMEGELTEEPFELEFRVIRKDGIIREVFQVMEYPLDDNRQVSLVYGTIQDITEKKNINGPLTPSRTRLKKFSSGRKC